MSKEVDALVHDLYHGDLPDSLRAPKALAKDGSPEAIAALIAALNIEDEWTLIEVVKRLSPLKIVEATQPLFQLLVSTKFEEEYQHELESAPNVQVYLGVAEQMGYDIRHLKDVTAQALAEIGTPEAIELLTQAAESPNENIQAASIAALGSQTS